MPKWRVTLRYSLVLIIPGLPRVILASAAMENVLLTHFGSMSL